MQFGDEKSTLFQKAWLNRYGHYWGRGGFKLSRDEKSYIDTA